MKNLLFLLIAIIALPLAAQENDYYVKKGYAVGGYDVTEYFNNKTVKGDDKYTHTYDSVAYKFTTTANLEKFKKNPTKFLPEYGGYCAYAIAITGDKVKVNPKTFEVRDGKLYLFYNALGVNTLKKWQDEGAEELQKKANISWKSVSKKTK